MSDDVTRAWIAGAEAARAADVAALRAERLRLRDEAAKARGMGLRHAAEDTTARALGAGVCADIVEGMPLPTPPAPPQSPLPSPDGGTGPQGDGAPAGGLSVAAGDGPTVEVWRVVWEDDGREPASPWPVEVWRHGHGEAARDMLSATRPVGDTPEAAILACRVLRGRRLRELVPPGMRTAEERVAHSRAWYARRESGLLDLTDEVAALAHCPDGHYWRPGAGIEQVVDIGDPGLPLPRREVVSLCPRCGFDWRLSSEDA